MRRHKLHYFTAAESLLGRCVALASAVAGPKKALTTSMTRALKTVRDRKADTLSMHTRADGGDVVGADVSDASDDDDDGDDDGHRGLQQYELHNVLPGRPDTAAAPLRFGSRSSSHHGNGGLLVGDTTPSPVSSSSSSSSSSPPAADTRSRSSFSVLEPVDEEEEEEEEEDDDDGDGEDDEYDGDSFLAGHLISGLPSGCDGGGIMYDDDFDAAR